MRTRRALLLAALLAPACAGSGRHARLAQDGAVLPVTRVVMYQNGVGYFERRGRVDGDLLVLQVRPEQINDLLKSLTVIDERAGRAVSVSLPLEKSSAQQLSELPEQVRNAGGLLAVLHVFRGARVTVQGAEGEVTGRVLGVEQLGVQKVDDTETPDWRVTLKTDDSALVVYRVASIERLELDDATLDIGLTKSLDVSLDEGQWKPVTLSVRLAGEQPHDVVVSYILAMPLWKPAYRLVVSGDKKPLLQGWAVVDNVSGEDWLGTRLSLVAGTPMSFRYDLHTPQFAERVDLTPRMRERAAAPVIERTGQLMPQAPAPAMASPYGAGAAAEPAPSRPSKAPSRSRSKSMNKEEYADAPEFSAPTPIEFDDRLVGEVQTAVQGSQAGALFRYDLTDPVDVPDRSSTLVAIINARVPGQEIVLFRPEQESDRPYRAAVFTNDSGFTLEKGPVAIYAGGTFVGEGFTERVERGATTFLTYAMDGNVNLERSDSSAEEDFRLLKIVGGVLETQTTSVSRTVYKVKNRNDQAIRAYVKTRRRPGWTLKAAPKEQIETTEALFLPLDVAAAQTGELTVEWTTPVKKQVAIDTDLSTQVLKAYLASGNVSPKVQAALNEVLRVKARLSAIANEDAELERQQRTLQQEQDRIRANLDMLRKTKGNAELMQSLVQKLGKGDDDLSRITSQLVRLSEERASLTAKMGALIGQVTLE